MIFQQLGQKNFATFIGHGIKLIKEKEKMISV
jgi:hypothetical protein